MTAPSGESAPILLGIGEVYLKGRNRRRFMGLLVANARRALSGIEGISVHPLHLRICVWAPTEAQKEVVSRLARVFGLSSISPAVTARKKYEDIEEKSLALAARLPGGSFKVITKRRDKRFPISSMALSARIGGLIHEQTNMAVDLHEPEHVLTIEIGPERTFIYAETIPGAGGLPAGSSGELCLLLSGGIDSPVAGWSAMRRGCTMRGLYFHSFPYTGDKTKSKVLSLARQLARWQGEFTLEVVNFTEVQKALGAHPRRDLVVLLYRRMMMRTASLIAAGSGAKALVTGESLNQVASQTLESIAVIDDCATVPVLRPLIAHDKAQIIALARQIGTYETSILPYDDTCSLFVPKSPALRPRKTDLERAEREFDCDAMARQLADSVEGHVVTGN